MRLNGRLDYNPPLFNCFINRRFIMENLRRLEVVAGIVTFLSTFLFIHYVDYPSFEGVAKLHNEPFDYDWTKALLVLIVPTFLIAISSYFHAFKQSIIGFVIIFILAGAISFLSFLSLLIGSAFEGHPFIGIAPGVFAFTTIVSAICNTFWRDSEK
jgi:hypothetical protein